MSSKAKGFLLNNILKKHLKQTIASDQQTLIKANLRLA